MEGGTEWILIVLINLSNLTADRVITLSTKMGPKKQGKSFIELVLRGILEVNQKTKNQKG